MFGSDEIESRNLLEGYDTGTMTAEQLAEQAKQYHHLVGAVNKLLTIGKMLLFTIWLTSFAIVLTNRSEAGWLSVLHWVGLYVHAPKVTRETQRMSPSSFYTPFKQKPHVRSPFPEIPKRLGLNFEFRTLGGLFVEFSLQIN
jgi:hypothetical protein